MGCGLPDIHGMQQGLHGLLSREHDRVHRGREEILSPVHVRGIRIQVTEDPQ